MKTEHIAFIAQIRDEDKRDWEMYICVLPDGKIIVFEIDRQFTVFDMAVVTMDINVSHRNDGPFSTVEEIRNRLQHVSILVTDAYENRDLWTDEVHNVVHLLFGSI